MLGVDRVKHTSLVGTIPVLEEEGESDKLAIYLT